MKRRISAILLIFILCTFYSIPVLAAETEYVVAEPENIIADTAAMMSWEEGEMASPEETGANNTILLQEKTRVVDMAALLSDSEESSLLFKLDEISERQQFDVVVVTVGSLDGKTPTAYADDFYDYNGYGFGAEYDGVLLLVSMEERDWSISTCGYGITALTDAGQEYISENFIPQLSSGDYAGAFNTFADLCDEFVTQAKNKNPYDVGNMPKGPLPLGRNLIIALVSGLLVALVGTGIMKGQLKSVHAKAAAGDYMKKGSLNIRESRDTFLYKHTDRRAKPKESSSSGGSSTHTSSSGRTHGGSSGKF